MAQKLTAKQEASLRIDYVPLDEIARFDKNPKKHDVGALVTSIRRYGFRDAPIFDGTLKALVAGHGRLKALEAMKGEGDKPPAGIIEHSAGQWLVPVQMGVDAKSAAEAKAFLIDHNTLTLSGGDLGVDSMLRLYDQGGLEELLKESGPTVSFDGEDIDELINGKKEVVEDDPSALIDAAKELEKKWGTKLGQLWILGEHRVLCGDSTKAEDVGRVMGGEKAGLLLTDPPYGIGYQAGGGSGTHGWKNYGKVSWDAERPSLATFSIARENSSEQIIWGGNYFADLLPPTMRWLVWDKGQREFSLADCELAWTSENKAARVFSYSRAKALQDGKVHPTQKPVALMVWCIEQATDPQTVLDVFLGSGTTLIAADQLKRKCYGLEISPQYVAVILERWSKATGGEPKLES